MASLKNVPYVKVALHRLLTAKTVTQADVTWGLDVYHGDRLLQWSETLAKFGVAWIKASEYLKDELFDAQWNASRDQVRRGPYHFFRPKVDPHESAHVFLNAIRGDVGEMGPVLDLEVFDGVPDLLERAKVWLDDVYASTGWYATIYSSRSVLQSAGAGKMTIWGDWKYGWLKRHKLWLADMTKEMNTFEYAHKVFDGLVFPTWPSPPPPWDKVDYWQWTWYGVPELIPGYNLEPYHKKQVDWNFAITSELPGEVVPTPTPKNSMLIEITRS